MTRLRIAGLAFVLCLGLAACDDRRAASDAGSDAANGEQPLPAPNTAAGSITGMPAPGAAGPRPMDPATMPTTPSSTPVATADATANAADVDPASAPVTDPLQGPGIDAAIRAIRDYYAAINDRDYARAYALWAAGANPQSQAQFADGFGDTLGVSVEIGSPGGIDAAAGSRYVEIPVTVSASQRDGSTRRQAGRYTLRAATAEGATPEQHSWHIAGASLQESR